MPHSPFQPYPEGHRFKPGQPVWAYVNDQPALRYYVHPSSRHHVLSPYDNLTYPVLHETWVLWPTKAGVLMWMIATAQGRIAHETEQLIRMHGQLVKALDKNE